MASELGRKKLTALKRNAPARLGSPDPGHSVASPFSHAPIQTSRSDLPEPVCGPNVILARCRRSWLSADKQQEQRSGFSDKLHSRVVQPAPTTHPRSGGEAHVHIEDEIRRGTERATSSRKRRMNPGRIFLDLQCPKSQSVAVRSPLLQPRKTSPRTRESYQRSRHTEAVEKGARGRATRCRLRVNSHLRRRGNRTIV
jgi:hypothetical protein